MRARLAARGLSAAAATRPPLRLTVELISDTMWPNGFIGKRHLMNAMREVASNPRTPGRPMGFNVVRVPFFLEPDYPTGEEFEETNRVRLLRKWGGQAGWDAQKRRHGMKERGREVGIDHFNLDRVASNTLASHRLVQWVTRTLGINRAEALYNDLNEKHFVGGTKLNDREMLVDAAAAAGADRDAARAVLEGDEGLEEIRRAQRTLQRLGVSGIPTFILGGEYRMPSGAVHASALVEAFRELEAVGGARGSVFAEDLAIPPEVLEEELVL